MTGKVSSSEVGGVGGWGGSNGVPPSAREGAQEECRCGDGGYGCSRQLCSAAGGQSAAVRGDAALRNASPQVPAGSSRPLLSGLTAVAALAAVHTL